MSDPLFDTPSNTPSSTPSSTPSNTAPDADGTAGGGALSSSGSMAPPLAPPMALPMAPPTGQPVIAQPYQWPRPAVPPMAPLPPPAVAGHRSDTYRGLAVASFVLSVVAVIGVLLFGLGFLDRASYGPSAADFGSSQTNDASGPIGPLTGSVPVAAGRSLPGEDLANALELRLRDSTTEITMNCPNTRKVGQGVVTVCHGQIEGEDWAVVVYFEDALGTFTLDLL